MKKQRKKACHLCAVPGCRRVSSVTIGGVGVCGDHVGVKMATTKKKTVSIRAKPGDKKGQDAMRSLLEAMGAGGGRR